MGVSWMKGWWGLAKTFCEEWAGQLSPEDNTYSQCYIILTINECQAE